VLPVCERYGMGVLVWSPLAAGWLSGRVSREARLAETQHRPSIQGRVFDPEREEHERKLDAVQKLGEIAREVGCTLPQMAIAFTQRHPAVTATILGPRTMEQLTSLLECSELDLENGVLDRIDEITPPGAGLFPEWNWRAPPLADPLLRRRPLQRAA
jgi:aryl-alcohol dehydrogenase-like predicted oxidoreductase